MDVFIVDGGNPLKGEITVVGAKNVALKALVASLLTSEELVFDNVPHIRDVTLMSEMLSGMGVATSLVNHTVRIKNGTVNTTEVPLEIGARLRTSSMVIGPLLARFGEVKIPNPGGCRIGARPIDRHIEGLKQMGAEITYHPEDGYFWAKAAKLHGTTIHFPKNTHTGTETIILAAVLAEGQTVIDNAAAEVEVDDLIALLVSMGARIKRTKPRQIVIEGVAKLHGTEYRLMPDRNEEVTFAVAAATTAGEITVHESRRQHLTAFLEAFSNVGGLIEEKGKGETHYSVKNKLTPLDIITSPHPGFMTDWQAPWALLMTQAKGASTIHETVFESRFSYVSELRKMGAQIEFFDPPVSNPEEFYNFNWADRLPDYHQAIRITGPTRLHNAVLTIDDLRAGATLLLAALTAEGRSYIHGVEQIDRGYEKIEERLRSLGANIQRIKE